MPAGKMRAKLAFQQRATGDDGFGNPVTGDFETVFTDYAEIIPRMGSEPVMASRLQGLQPVTIRVHSHSATRDLDSSWRAVGRGGEVYSIVSPPVNVSQKNDYIDMLATLGGQTDG